MDSRNCRWIVLLAALLATGCKSAYVDDPLTQKFGGGDPESQMEFWHQLSERPLTANDEAFHGLLLYVDGNDPNENFEQRVAAMKARKMLSKNFDQPANQAVHRGVLAMAICRALDIRGGVNMHLLGPTPRYATRELMWVGIYPVSSPRQTFSGTEFLGIMGRVEDWQRGNPANAPAAEMPSEVAEEVKDIQREY
jgi:hypothetical protein